MNILFLCTQVFGGRGGIAKFNRDLCTALATDPLLAQLTVLPRVAPVESGYEVPEGVRYRSDAAGTKTGYTIDVLKTSVVERRSTFDAVICGHINLLPVAAIASRIQSAPLLLTIHGVEIWEAHPSLIVRLAVPQVDTFVAVSKYTKERFLDWAPLESGQGKVIPDCVEMEAYEPGPKRNNLLNRYGLESSTILLTLGRLSRDEQYRKGHDEILEVLPELARDIPDIAYLICGEGDDRPRLEKKARQLGIEERVVFAGYVAEEEKADHYRLADAFVMPGYGEGFGIVYLEAMACGIPVVASSKDASREAVRGGKLGTIVDPNNSESLKRGIHEALRCEQGVPEGLEFFSYDQFRKRWHAVLEERIEDD